MAGFKKQIQTTLKLSSMKGVPRIIGAPNMIQKILWTCAVLFFLGCCMFHVSTNVIGYLKFTKVVTINQLTMDFLHPNATVPFPTVAICNLNPFTSNVSLYKAHGIPQPKEFHRKVLDITSCVNCTIGQHRTMEILRASLLTLRGYYQYVGKEGMRKIGHKNLVVQCTALVASSSAHVSIPCEKLSDNYTYIHPDHGLCYAYNAKSTRKHLVIGYHFILHLDSSFDNINSEFDPRSLFNQNAGARIYTFDPQSIPTDLGAFTLAGPGTLSVSKLAITRVDRLTTPYSDRECVDIKNAEEIKLDNRLFNMNYYSCLGLCTAQYVQGHCNCTDMNLLHNPEIESKEYGYCSSIDQPKQQLFKMVDCSERVKGAGASYCSKKCKEPCTEIKYRLFTSYTKWPLPSQTGTFYTDFIKNKPFEYQYNHKKNIYKKLAAGDKSVLESERFYALRIIEDNFASVGIYSESLYYTHLKDEPKLEIAALISQLGGTLNLWSGITVLIFAEIIDLIIRLQLKSKRKSSSLEQDNGIKMDYLIQQTDKSPHNSSPSSSQSNSVEL